MLAPAKGSVELPISLANCRRGIDVERRAIIVRPGARGSFIDVQLAFGSAKQAFRGRVHEARRALLRIVARSLLRAGPFTLSTTIV